MLTKIVAIAALILCGFFGRVSHSQLVPTHNSLSDFGAALVPVLFSYGGWQTTNFVAAEIREPRRTLPHALLLGVAGVALLYTLVNVVCLRVLGVDLLRSTSTPASAVMRSALGNAGANFIAAAIAISALGFLAQSILTAPRVYFAMANDGLFFRSVARVSPHTHVPIIAIVLQSIWTIVIALSGRYDQILNYVVSMDFIFFGLTAATLFVFRKRESVEARLPFHPWTTIAFIAICWAVVANTIWRYPTNTLIGMSILLAGVPVYFLWSRRAEFCRASAPLAGPDDNDGRRSACPTTRRR
jgi:basic amino acid/polyamine antiporter, APA family